MRTISSMMAIALSGLWLGAAPQAAAESFETYDSLDFGSWCTEVAHYGQERCVEGREADQQAYQRYLKKTATYESEMIKKRDDDRVERERVDRMGEVTPDTNRDRIIDNTTPDQPR